MKKLFNRFRHKYTKEQLILLNKIQRCKLKLRGNVLKIKFLNQCIHSRVCPSVIHHIIKMSKLKQILFVEKLFIKDEIGGIYSINKYIKLNFVNV